MVNHRRGPWSHTEDRCLIELVQRRGPHNWVRISHDIQTRSPKQCRERYHQNLKPNLNHNPITPEEGEAIERMVAEMGKKWAEIARRLNGRSDNAVKNWWNGGQHRRKRNPEREDPHRQEQSHASHSSYHYPTAPHHQVESGLHTHEQAHTLYHFTAPPDHSQSLPPIRHYPETSYHDQSRRPSLNPSIHSPHAMKLPHPQGFEAYPGSRPQPLQLPPYQQYPSRVPGYETPMPSPGHSIASVDAPSLVTDTGSESRSPHMAISPFENTHLPIVGPMGDRRNSSARCLPVSGFSRDDDDHSVHYGRYSRRSSVQLPSLSKGLPPTALSLPYPQAASSHATSPLSRQLPHPAGSPLQTLSRSVPTSPQKDCPRDNRMRIDSIL